VASARSLGVLLSLLALSAMAGCGEDQSAAPPLQATAISSVDCSRLTAGGQGYAHTTLGYNLCFPKGWTSRDYTAEPGGGGALSVVAFGPPSAVPTHVPSSGSFIPPIEVRVVAGPKGPIEASLAQGPDQAAQFGVGVAGIAADKITLVDSGPANGAVIIVFEHQGNTFEIEEAPGGIYDVAFQHVLISFSFPTS
jgi:hypothetical protein